MKTRIPAAFIALLLGAFVWLATYQWMDASDTAKRESILRQRVMARQEENMASVAAAQKQLGDSIGALSETFDRFTAVVAKMEAVNSRNTAIVDAAEKNQARSETIIGKGEEQAKSQVDFLTEARNIAAAISAAGERVKRDLAENEERIKALDAQRIIAPVRIH